MEMIKSEKNRMKRMFKQKKSVFFTFIGIFIIILAILLVESTNKYRYWEKSSVIHTRIETIDSFIDDVINDLDREMYIGGYRGLLSMQKYIRQKQGFIDDINSSFEEVFLYGTINTSGMDIMSQGSQSADFISWLERINEEADELNIYVNATPNNVTLKHNDPFVVTIVFNLTMDFNDAKGLAEWHFTEIYERNISIIGFEDPIYTVFTDDKVSVIINRTDEINLVQNNDTGVLLDHINHSRYLNSSRGPSFLMRLEGDLGASDYGIESLVDLEKFNRQGIAALNKTLIDFRYFNETYVKNSQDRCNVHNMPAWFRIDPSSDASYTIYEIDELDSDICG